MYSSELAFFRAPHDLFAYEQLSIQQVSNPYHDQFFPDGTQLAF